MSRRRIWLFVLLGVVLVVLVASFLWSGPLSCGTDQTWSFRRGGCWPAPAAY